MDSMTAQNGMGNMDNMTAQNGMTVQSDSTHDQEYTRVLEAQREHFKRLTAAGQPLFHTNVEGLFDLYLQHLPEGQRQYHTCNTCRHFMERYGDLVTINTDGTLAPVMWKEVDLGTFYSPAMSALYHVVKRARITGVFLSEEVNLGQPKTGTWTHFAVPDNKRYKNALLTAGQAMAEKHEDFLMLNRALELYPKQLASQALVLLESDLVKRSEKAVEIARWLYNLHEDRRANIIWSAVATAPTGYCHINSTMISTLLDDLASGMAVEGVIKRWNEKMHPLQYRRPQAAPSSGNIEQAEKIVEKLGIAPSLERRFATMADIPEFIWQPAKVQEKEGGVFGHLKKQEPTIINLPSQTMTFNKFLEDILPKAQSLSLFLSSTNYPLCAFTTAVHADAPPILQWDLDDQRNPVAWYQWAHGSTPRSWSLSEGIFHPVVGLTAQPSMWFGNKSPHQGESVVFLIAGMRESRTKGGLVLFPETLKSGLHQIRSTIEAHSKATQLQGETDAAGVMIARKGSHNLRVRVTTSNSVAEYILDRWE